MFRGGSCRTSAVAILSRAALRPDLHGRTGPGTPDPADGGLHHFHRHVASQAQVNAALYLAYPVGHDHRAQPLPAAITIAAFMACPA